MSHKKKYSEHHLIPQMNDDGSKFTQDKQNKEIIKDSTHVNWHRVFAWETPQQQLLHVLDFNKQILNDEFVKDLLKVLDKYIYNYYKIETHIVSELGSLLNIEQEYFSNNKPHENISKREK